MLEMVFLLFDTVTYTQINTNWLDAILGQDVDGLSDLQVRCYIVDQPLRKDDVQVFDIIWK